MSTDLDRLTEREKETLRLLLRGYDAKSIAAEFDLSVHTINERLRDARRKLNVSSSKAAARLLAEYEGGANENPVPKQIGGADKTDSAEIPEHGSSKAWDWPIAWIAGGMFIMSLFVAAIAVITLNQSATVTPAAYGTTQASEVAAEAEDEARQWVALIDASNWAAAFDAAGSAINSQLTLKQFTDSFEAARAPLGALESRKLAGAQRTDTLPGAPKGDYEVLQFEARFSNWQDGTETVIMQREGSEWKVAGYFVR
jgi:DNA-binding CsgD family transcriptional regulator